MARIRTLKPEFWDHAQLNAASVLARLTFVGLVSLADDQGIGRADTEWLWGRLHSGGGGALKAQWRRTLSELEALKDDDGNLVVFYEVAGARYYWLPGFCRQQYIEKPGKSKLPPPPNSGNVPLQVPSRMPLEQGSGIKEQGSGRGEEEATPPPPLPPVLAALEEGLRKVDAQAPTLPDESEAPMLPGTPEGRLFRLAKKAHIQAKDDTLRRYLRGWISQKGIGDVERILMEPRIVGKGIIAIQDWYFNDMAGTGFLGEIKK